MKQVVNDYSSYQPVETNVFKLDSAKFRTNEHRFVVEHKFRAKNSFGAYMIGNYHFKMDSAFNIIEATEY